MIISRLLIVLLLGVLLAGCATTETDPYKDYRKYSSQQLYQQGVANLAKGKYDDASKEFDAFIGLHPFGRYAEVAQLDSIYANYKNNDDAGAVASAERYIAMYPQSRHVAYAYYIQGLVQFHMGLTWMQRLWGTDPAPRSLTDKKQAFLAFSQVVRLYPHSRFAPSALQHMHYIRNEIARKDLLIAQYYWDRGAYVAAANRASSVVQHYQGTPSVKLALALMVKSYHKLSLPKMVAQTQHIMQASYARS